MEQGPEHHNVPDEPTDDELAGSFEDAADATGPVSQERAHRFYDRIRASIQKYSERKGGTVEKSTEYLLLVPDMFILLWRLASDARVSGKNKVMLVSGIGYFIFPFDLLPEGILGPIGYLDDLVFAVYVLNKMLVDTDVSVLRAHWSGKEDILDSIQKVLKAADSLIGKDLVTRIKKIVR